MPDFEVGQKMDALSRRRQVALEDVAKVARALLPVLKDHNLTNTASELGEKLFQLEAVQQEMESLVLANPKEFMDALMRRLAK